MLVIKNLHKMYGDNIVLDNITISIEQGKILGLIGPNGSGKTTFLKSIVNKISYKGKISVDGELNFDFIKKNRNQLLYIPDEPFVYDYLTGNEFIKFILDLLKIDFTKVQEEILSLTTILNMTNHLEKLIADYSYGMKHKIALIPFLISKPKILILDEPSTGLDLAANFALQKIFTALKNKGTTIIFSSHNLSLITSICNRILILDNKKHLFLKDLENKTEKEIEQLYLNLINEKIDTEIKKL